MSKEIKTESIKRLKKLTDQLEKYCIAYYMNDDPITTDAQYDKLFDEVSLLEKELGTSFSNSPTQKVKGYVSTEFKKITHTSPMLSAQKTKDNKDVKKFIGDKKCVFSYKLDGLTIVLRYKNGTLIQAITRGDGEVGEDVTENAKRFTNIPLNIDFKEYLELRGEALISWDNFNRLKEIPENYGITHPRSLAAGAIRQKNSDNTAQKRVEFHAHELVKADTMTFTRREEEYKFLNSLGFDVVEYKYFDPKTNDFDLLINSFSSEYKLPVDGIIIRYDDVVYGKSLGKTAHHPLDMIAKKWEDCLYETTLRDIEWSTSKNGDLYPTAVFDTVVIDGTEVSRATLHNIKYIKGLQLGIGDTIKVSKRNMIIPAVEENITCSDTYVLPTLCPTCGEKLSTRKIDKTEYLFCSNTKCFSQILGKFNNFVSKKALNIEGLSESILKILLSKKFISDYVDIYHLSKYKNQIQELQGFGPKSYEKLINAIEKSRKTTLAKFICGLDIPLIGKTASNDLANYFNTFDNFISKVENDEITINGLGDKMKESIKNYIKNYKDNIIELSKEFEFECHKTLQTSSESPFSGKSFCITGSFNIGSREDLKEKIEKLGGKFVSGVSKKTDILVAGEKCGSKLSKAQEYGIRIIEETELKGILGV